MRREKQHSNIFEGNSQERMLMFSYKAFA